MRRARLTAIVTTAAILLLAPAAAHAVSYPGARPAAAMELVLMHAVAARFWDQRNVPSACTATALLLADDLTDTDHLDATGRADPAGCAIWLRADYVEGLLDVVRNPRLTFGRRSDARALCRAIVHEEGHVRGLEHTPTGVMSPTAAAMPHDCVELARVLSPKAPVSRRTGDPHARTQASGTSAYSRKNSLQTPM